MGDRQRQGAGDDFEGDFYRALGHITLIKKYNRVVNFETVIIITEAKNAGKKISHA